MGRRAWIIGVTAVAALAVAAVVFWLGLGRASGPGIEVIVPSAPICLGDKVLATAAQGDRFPVEGARGPWYKVKVRVEGKDQFGWIHYSQVRRTDPPPTGQGPIEAQVLTVDSPDEIAGERPPGFGTRWALFGVQVRALEADAEGTCPVHTDRFVFRIAGLNFARPLYVKEVEVKGKPVERLVESETLRLAVGEMRLLPLAVAAPKELAIRSDWSVGYTPPEPSAAIRLGTPRPATATPPKPTTPAPSGKPQ